MGSTWKGISSFPVRDPIRPINIAAVTGAAPRAAAPLNPTSAPVAAPYGISCWPYRDEKGVWWMQIRFPEGRMVMMQLERPDRVNEPEKTAWSPSQEFVAGGPATSS